MKRIALFSAANKTPAMFDFARELVKRDFTIWASGGTFAALQKEKIESIDIATVVGKAILNHRVVTLSREIFAGILASLDSSKDRDEVRKLIGGIIQVVYVDLYHLGEAIETKDPGVVWQSLREKIDIGGPSLLRAAAKGDRFVVSNESQIPTVLKALDGWSSGGDTTQDCIRLRLAIEAEKAAIKHAVDAVGLYSLFLGLRC